MDESKADWDQTVSRLQVFFFNSGINAHGGKSYKCVVLVAIFHFRAKGLGLYFAVLADAVSY